MKNLTTFSPAEVRLILDAKFISEKDTMKLTFQDLVMRGVLRVLPNEVEEDKVYLELVNPPNKPKIHESIFLWPFESDEELYWPLSGYIREVVKWVKRRYSFPKEIYQNYLTEYATQSWWQGLWGNLKLTRKGEHLQATLQDEIEEVRHLVEAYREQQPEKVKELALQIGANLLLAAEELGVELPEVDPEVSMGPLATAAFVSGCGGLVWDDSYDSDFDAGYSSGCSSSDGGSGCGGDSGCSGCSGCGGD